MPFFELIVSMFSQVLYLTGYIARSDSFPPALPQEEEEKYLKLLSEGNDEARRVLIEHNLRLVAHIVKKYGDESNSDDFISIGTIGLIKGIDTYDFETAVEYARQLNCDPSELIIPDTERFPQHIRNISISMKKAYEASNGKIRFRNTLEGLKAFEQSSDSAAK